MERRLRKTMIIISSVIILLIVLSLIGLIVTGASIGWGPFGNLYNWQKQVDKVKDANVLEDNQNQIVFYGASNFRLWKTMKEDLSNYKVQNHGFGGSTDKLLMEYADQILYPYNPSIVVFQTGSNDYVGMKGTREEIVRQVIEQKELMFETFHEKLPTTKFIVLSGILMPGRDSFTPFVIDVNKALEEFCSSTDYIYYVNSQGLTYDNVNYKEEYFVKDGIHLTRDAQKEWGDVYIKPAIEKVIKAYSLSEVRTK